LERALLRFDEVSEDVSDGYLLGSIGGERGKG